MLLCVDEIGQFGREAHVLVLATLDWLPPVKHRVKFAALRNGPKDLRGCFHFWLEMHRTAVNLNAFMSSEETMGDMQSCQRRPKQIQ